MTDALDSYLTGWREADPLHAAAWLFLRDDERVRFGTLAALESEWLKVIREVSEPQVAAARLGWWREELGRAATGDARHPLARALSDDALLGRIPLSRWTAVVDGAFPVLGMGPAADFAGQRAAVAPLTTAIAELDTRAWFGADASSPRAAAVANLACLTANTRALAAEVAHARSPLPMNLLARHGLSIEDLATDGAPRRAALRDYVDGLRRGFADAITMPGPLTLFADVRLRHDLHTLDAASTAGDPLAALRAPGRGFRSLLRAWRAARAWRGIPDTGNDDDC